MYIEELSEIEGQRIEEIFEKEINDYLNKIICKEKFIYLIKKRCNFMEFYYLYKKYIGEIKVITRLPENINLDQYDHLIETYDKANVRYNDNLKIQKYPKKGYKKLVRIEKWQDNHSINDINKIRRCKND